MKKSELKQLIKECIQEIQTDNKIDVKTYLENSRNIVNRMKEKEKSVSESNIDDRFKNFMDSIKSNPNVEKYRRMSPKESLDTLHKHIINMKEKARKHGYTV